MIENVREQQVKGQIFKNNDLNLGTSKEERIKQLLIIGKAIIGIPDGDEEYAKNYANNVIKSWQDWHKRNSI